MTELDTGSEHWGYVYTADDERLIALLDNASNPLTNWTVRGLGNEVLTRDDHYPAAGSPPPLPPETCPGPNGIFCDDFEEGTVGAWSSNSGLQTRTITDYLFRDGQLLASNTLNGGGAEHFSLDHLGTPRIVTDDVFGSVVATHTYFPFGQEATPTDQDAEPLKFTAHERDLQTTPSNTADDLDYMHARFRSPLTGRFLTVDVATADPSHSQTWNRYSYALGNPARFIDPDGRAAEEPSVFDQLAAYFSDRLNAMFPPAPQRVDPAAQALVDDGEISPSQAVDLTPGNNASKAQIGLNDATANLLAGAVVVGGQIGAAKAFDAVAAILRPAGRLIGEAGSSSSIRFLGGGSKAAGELFERLAAGGKVVSESATQKTVEIKGVGTVTLRTVSTKSKGVVATIDVAIRGLGIRKVKFR